MSEASPIRLAIVGALEINRDDLAGVFDTLSDTLQAAVIRFGGLEALFPNAARPSGGKMEMCNSPGMLEDYVAGGFDVVVFASNHCLDYGIEPFVDTLDSDRIGDAAPYEGDLT